MITAPTDMAAIPINTTLQAPWFATRAKLQDEIAGEGAVAYKPDCVPDAAHPYFSNCYGTYLTYAMVGQRPLAQASVVAGGARTRAASGRVTAQGMDDLCKIRATSTRRTSTAARPTARRMLPTAPARPTGHRI